MKITLLPIRFGIAISGSLVAFFLTLSLFNLHSNPVYSFFNAIIIAFGIYDAIKSYKFRQGNKFTYTKGFTIGITSGFIATILFAMFFMFYISKIDNDFIPNFLESLNRLNTFQGVSVTNFKIQENAVKTSNYIAVGIIYHVLTSVAIIILGFVTTIIQTLVIMKLIKMNHRSTRNINE
jgi:CRISPR/Cas system endoribonuclease Cas6 (RAMP superfamily)